MKCTWKDEPAVMKMSNHIDFVLELEEEAWNHLKKLNCLHFCEVFEKLPIKPGERRYCLFYKEITNNSRNDSLGKLIFEQAHHPQRHPQLCEADPRGHGDVRGIGHHSL